MAASGSNFFFFMECAYLIIDGPEKCIRFVGFPSDPACQHVFARIVKPVFDQDPGHIFHLAYRWFVSLPICANLARR